jgi:ADP-heptose:LPS heptosyltransferase
VENDFLEREIQERIQRAKWALDRGNSEVVRENKKVDQIIIMAKQMRAKEVRESVDTNWTNEEEALWNTFKQRLQEEELNN